MLIFKYCASSSTLNTKRFQIRQYLGLGKVRAFTKNISNLYNVTTEKDHIAI